MLDKVNRLDELAPQIAEMLNANKEDLATVARAAALSKSDLVTNMVVEMTSLQGIIGEIYAKQAGEPDAVAQAIREHYLPRLGGDAAPASLPGLALALADKLDSLVGLFAVGAIPTGSADPFGLRRAALGIVNNLIETETDFSVSVGVAAAAARQPVPVSDETIAETVEFVTRRLQGVLLELGFRHDVVEAVLAARGDNPYAALRACWAVAAMIEQPWWEGAFTAYARAARITRGLDTTPALNPAAYQEPVEQPLHDAYMAAAAAMAAADEPAVALGEQLRVLQAPIHDFFENVLVNADDESVRSARLGPGATCRRFARGRG